MTEKKFKKFINDLSFYKSLLKPQYLQYFDTIASLYINRKIEKKSQVEKLFSKLTGRGTAPQSAIKLIEKYKTYKSVKGVIKGTKERIYHIKAFVKCRVTYTKPKVKSYIETFIESRKLSAFTQQQAEEEYTEYIYETYNQDLSTYDVRVLSIKFKISAVEKPEREREKKKWKLENMKMKKCNSDELFLLPFKDNENGLCELCGMFESTYESFGYFCDFCHRSKSVQRAEKMMLKKDKKINYDYIKEHKNFNCNGISNQCVINNFIGMYPELKLKRDELIKLCSNFYNPSRGLDDGLEVGCEDG
jgi:hypothetical protein